MPRRPEHPPIQVTRSCPQAPGIELLREWCTMAGHFWVRDHDLDSRSIGEMVLLYCVGGRGWFRLRNQRYEIGPGDLFFCPANVDHGYGCDPDAGWELWWTHFCGGQAAVLCRLAGLTSARPVCRPRDEACVVRCFSRLADSLATHDDTAAWDAAEKLHSLLLALIRQSAQPSAKEDLTELVDEDCGSLDELVARSGYSKYHFSRLFKAQTGRSPWRYVMDRKLERAKELLLGTRLTIKEIAATLGFENADYFAKLFSRHAGVTPKAYRGRTAPLRHRMG